MADFRQGPATADITTGRQQRAATPTAIARTPDLSKYYRRRLPGITPGDYEFHLDLMRPRQPTIPIDTAITQLNWIDEQSVLTGSLTCQRPDPEDPRSFPVTRGHLIRCRVRWGSNQTYELWTMRAGAVQIEVDTGVVTVPLQDDMALIETSTRDWFFRTTKHRRHGYYLHEIAQEVARALGFRLGNVTRGTVRQTLSKRNASGLDVLRAAAANEKQATGRSLILRFRNGRLDLIPLQYNPLLYVFSRQIQTALITQKGGNKVPTTVLTGRGRLGVGKHTKKISFTTYSRDVVRALGYVPQIKDYGRVKDHKDLRDQVKRDLAKLLQLNDSISIQHQGVPFISRGDAAMIDLPKEGYADEGAFVFVTRAEHNVQAGVYQMNLDLDTKDPIVAQEKADAAARAKARGNRTTPTAAVGSGPRWLVPTSAEDDPPGASASCGPLPADRRGYSVLSVSGHSSDAGTAGQALSPGSVWPCGISMTITNPRNGRTVTGVPHVDNGAGSDSILPVIGLYPTTRSELGTAGNEPMIIQRSDGGPLHPTRGTPA